MSDAAEDKRRSGFWDKKTNPELRAEAMTEGGLSRVLSDRLFDMEMATGYLLLDRQQEKRNTPGT